MPKDRDGEPAGPSRPLAEIPAGPLTVVAPRVADAVRSCGALLADRPGSVVAAPLAGARTADALARDLEALGILAAEPTAADASPLLDGVSVEVVAAHLQDALTGDRGPSAVLVPLGVGSDESHLVADAGLLVFADLLVTGRVDRPWFLYLDDGATGDEPAARLAHRTELLEARGLHLEAVEAAPTPAAMDRRRTALACLAPGDQVSDSVRTPEGVWLLSHPGGFGFGSGETGSAASV